MNTLKQAFIRPILYTLILVIGLVFCYFMLGTLPQLLGRALSVYSFVLIQIISALICFLSLIFFLKKKWDIVLYKKAQLPSLTSSSIFILLTIIICIINRSLGSIQDLFTLSDGLINKLDFRLPIIEDKTHWIFSFFFAVILGPLLEELFFRGLIMEYLQRYYSPLLSILLTTFLFTLSHVEYNYVPTLFISGLLFSFIYYKTKSLSLCVISHSLCNLSLYFISST